MRRTTTIIWNNHPELTDKHAFLGGSNYHWLGDDDEKLMKRYLSMRAKELGTDLHELAARLISYGFKLSETEASQYRALGNAIPPVMFWYIMRAVKKALERGSK